MPKIRQLNKTQYVFINLNVGLKNQFGDLRAKFSDSRHFQPVPGRILCVESECWVKDAGCLHPGAKSFGKTTSEKTMFSLVLFFYVFVSFCFFVFFELDHGVNSQTKGHVKHPAVCYCLRLHRTPIRAIPG